MTRNQGFRLITGESKEITVTLVDNFSLVGATIAWYLKRGDGTVLLTKTTENGGIVVTGNQFDMVLTSTETTALAAGDYHHFAKVTEPGGEVSYVMSGDVRVDPVPV